MRLWRHFTTEPKTSVVEVECVGTAALREGANRQELIDAAAASVWGSGDLWRREPVFRPCTLDHLPKGRDALVVDVGGASTEEFVPQQAVGSSIARWRSVVFACWNGRVDGASSSGCWQAVIHHIDQAFASLPEAKLYLWWRWRERRQRRRCATRAEESILIKWTEWM